MSSQVFRFALAVFSGVILAEMLMGGKCEGPIVVRTVQTPGGPQIMLNGSADAADALHRMHRTIPPRMFWGSPRGGQIGVTADWAEQSFEFSPASEVKGTGTLHFRFGHVAGEVWISDVKIVEAAGGKDALPPGSFATPQAFAEVWRIWPPGKENTVGKIAVANGALRVTINDPPDKKWPDFHLYSQINLNFKANVKYRCSWRARIALRSDRAVPPRSISPAVHQVEGGVWHTLGSPPGRFLEQIAMARDAGVNLVSFGAPSCWVAPDKGDNWAPMDDLCRSIIAVNPKVLLVPRVGADAPGWWLEQHAEAYMVYEGGQRGKKSSVSHRQYRADAAAHLERLCRHLTEAFPEHFAGIHPCGQNTGEWFYEDTWKRPLSGYDPATLRAWREWLRARGASDWASAEVPTPEARHSGSPCDSSAPNGMLRDPAKERRLIDFARFQQEEMADMVVALAAAARRGTGGRKLVVFFYGYHYEFSPCGNGAPVAGHYALRRVLASPDIDIVCSPISYFDRAWLCTAPAMSSTESVMLAGKLWLNEDDSRTYLDPRQAQHVQEGGLVNLEQTQQVMLRNTAQEALRGFGSWWMDLPGEGWFADPAIWKEMVRLRPVDEAMARRQRPFTPEIASIISEDSLRHLAGGSHVLGRPLIYESRGALGRSGAPYGQYMLDDVIAGKVPARLQILLAAWALTPEERRALSERRPPGVTRVWCYAPGYLLPDRADVGAMREVTGFAHRLVSLPDAVATPTEAGRKLGLAEPWGPKKPIQPLFTVEAQPDEILATYSDGSPAVAVRRGEKGIDVFAGVPQLTPPLVRALARMAGVHLFAEEDVALWAADPYISIHALKAGPLTIRTGRAGPVTDALDGVLLGSGPEVRLNLREGETRVLRY